MPKIKVNGVHLYYEFSGRGSIPLVLVHGAWASHHTWDALLPHLADSYRVLTYDLRGHSQSERPSGQGKIEDDVRDLAALIEHFDLAPVWAIGNSFGGLIILRLAGKYPQLMRGIMDHEPPLFSLVADDPQAAPLLAEMRNLNNKVLKYIAEEDNEGAARQFIEEVLGPGSWAKLPKAYQQELAGNAPTFADMVKDPHAEEFDPSWIQSFPYPVIMTTGDQSNPIVKPMYERLGKICPNVTIVKIPGSRHVPHRENPAAFTNILNDWVQDGSAQPRYPKITYSFTQR